MHLIESRPRLLLSLLAVVYLLPGLHSLPLIDRDEPRFAHATAEMFDRSDFVVPFFNNEYRFDKPPLTYWWMAAHFYLMGENEFSARLHSAVAAFLAALVIFQIGKRLCMSQSASFLAAAGWLSCLQVLIHSRMAVADMPLLLFITLSFYVLIGIAQQASFSKKDLLSLAAIIGLGLLAKGPLAFAIPLLAIWIWAALEWKLGTLDSGLKKAHLALLIGTLLAGIIFAAWAIPAQLSTDGAFLQTATQKHVIDRGLQPLNGRTVIPGLYYLIAILPFFLPWSPLLPEALWGATRSRERRLLLAWALSAFLIFSFYATQLPHYILPSYPALFLLLHITCGNTPNRKVGRISKGISMLSIALPLLLGAFIGFCAIRGITSFGSRPIFFMLLFLALIFIQLAIAAILAWRRCFKYTLLFAATSTITLFPLADQARECQITLKIHKAFPTLNDATPCAHLFEEGSLVWYYDRTWDFENDDLSKPQSFQLVEIKRWRIDGDTLSGFLAGKTPEPSCVTELPIPSSATIISGWNPATSCWIEVAVIPPSV